MRKHRALIQAAPKAREHGLSDGLKTGRFVQIAALKVSINMQQINRWQISFARLARTTPSLKIRKRNLEKRSFTNLFVVPKHFFVRKIIEERNNELYLTQKKFYMKNNNLNGINYLINGRETVYIGDMIDSKTSWKDLNLKLKMIGKENKYEIKKELEVNIKDYENKKGKLEDKMKEIDNDIEKMKKELEMEIEMESNDQENEENEMRIEECYGDLKLVGLKGELEHLPTEKFEVLTLNQVEKKSLNWKYERPKGSSNQSTT